ncbi:type VI secretion system baseplate subunit TssE [Rhodobacteraceae bacterium 2376]|uniref:Type VI secretion system baseplate subunit TssE n=1 Tax=Rhabdonatronobacter sediminivivens TaxID=2743469 RepID=A0A7Z0I146_9RHOB|nr:type VI secretion system baseplate subunit TssE [Rhabdonatronobacter sediminivivens]NYS25634.1 type VI secretion system baseplate subunit TssE [Rhabdonatronobacter sediminivivens]
MSDRTITDRLQPSLLDRLTDDEPDKRTESRDRRVIDIQRLREIVQRDLAWLLNTQNAETWIEPDRHPQAARSVLNYGIGDLSGSFATGDQASAIRESIRQAIEAFEPRLRRGTVEVELSSKLVDRGVVVTFDIRAEMWAHPIPMELYLRSEVDVTTGSVRIEGGG